MELQTFHYNEKDGWSVSSFPEIDSENTLILVFSAPEFYDRPDIFTQLKNHFPKSQMIGCSSAGEIFGSSVYDKSIAVAAIKFKNTPIKIAHTEIKDSKNSRAAGEKIAEHLKSNDLTGIFILSDGLNVNGTELVKGLNTVAKHVIVTGGLAGDGSHFKKTWAILNGKIHTNLIVAVGFYGNAIHIGHGSKGGWDIFGPERRITKSKNNILYELDNQPALTLYKEYLGERANGLPATGLLFPLAIRKDEHDKRQLVRTILAVDEKEKSLIFAGDMPTGYFAQLMRANFDRLITGATEAGKLAHQTLGNIQSIDLPILAIAVSCVGRKLLLGERTEEETESTLESLPSQTQQIGFYSYGELSPYGLGTCDLHNQTMTLTTLYEEETES